MPEGGEPKQDSHNRLKSPEGGEPKQNSHNRLKSHEGVEPKQDSHNRLRSQVIFLTICVILIHDILLSDVPDHVYHLKSLHITKQCT
jgi:hypothetical protein